MASYFLVYKNSANAYLLFSIKTFFKNNLARSVSSKQLFIICYVNMQKHKLFIVLLHIFQLFQNVKVRIANFAVKNAFWHLLTLLSLK